MSSVIKFAGFVFTCAVTSVGMAQTAPLSLVVNHEYQTVQTPTLGGAAGISYAGGSPSPLKVYTGGFLFCSNVSPSTVISTPAYFVTAHEDQSFTPAHPWSFTTATDVASVSYDGNQIAINRSIQTTLTCHGARVDGSVPTSSFDGIFDTSHESSVAANYSHLINWVPTTVVDWATVDWSQVPTNPCLSSVSQPAAVVEAAACAAVTGVRPAEPAPVRAPTLWTAADSINFTYVFRVDARFGAQPPQAINEMKLPTLDSGIGPQTASGETIKLVDAYDSTYLSNTGSYCYLATLPTTLSSAVCTGATTYPLSGPLSPNAITISPPPVGSGFTSFYVAVNRLIGQGSHPSLTTPVVGVSILVDPPLVAEGGDKFVGDDVAFGFIPSSTNPSGFPWMYGQ